MRPGALLLSTTAGSVAPGEKVRVDVRLRPGVPGAVAASIVVTVAHFQPITIAVSAEAVFGSIACDLPIDDEDDADWRAAHALASSAVREKRATAAAALACSWSLQLLRGPSAAGLPLGRASAAALTEAAVTTAPTPAKAPAPPGVNRSRPLCSSRVRPAPNDAARHRDPG